MTRILWLLLVLSLSVSCSSDWASGNDSYTIDHFKTKGRFGTYIVIRAFNKISIDSVQPIAVTVRINDVQFNDLLTDKDLKKELIFQPVPDKPVNIEAYLIGYETVKLEQLRLTKNDSLIVNIQMIEPTEPFNNFE